MTNYTQARASRYTTKVRSLMKEFGHATNVELAEALRHDFPRVSATTVHRITTRMHGRGEIRLAPSNQTNCIRYDYNVIPHDHFMCEECGSLRDTNLSLGLRSHIEESIGEDCSISGSLTVSGICKKCHKEKTA